MVLNVHMYYQVATRLVLPPMEALVYFVASCLCITIMLYYELNKTISDFSLVIFIAGAIPDGQANLENMAGVLFVLMMGITLSFIVVVLECLLASHKDAKRARKMDVIQVTIEKHMCHLLNRCIVCVKL